MATLQESPFEDALLDEVLDERTARRPVAVAVLTTGLVAGVAGDALLRRPDVGLNLTIYLLVLCTGAVVITRRRLAAIPRPMVEPLVASVVFALLLMLRDAPMLTAWNALAALGSLAIAAAMAAPVPLDSLGRASLAAIFGRMARLLPQALGGAGFYLHSELPLTWAGHARHLYVVRVIGRAAVVTIAAAVALGALLSAGDAVFASMSSALVAWNARSIALHIAFTALFAWPVFGWLNSWANSNRPRAGSARPMITLGVLDSGALLIGMNAALGLFLVAQIRVLFGGQRYVQAVTGLTLAEYARSGFFVLSAVVGVVLVALLALDATRRDGSVGRAPLHRHLSRTLVVMVAPVLLSAMVRLKLYVDTYGLSLDRFYASVAIVWMALVIVGFAATVLRERRGFPAFVVRSFWLTLAAVNLANPEAVIVSANGARWAQGKEFDFAYHATLTADAAPRLAALLNAQGTGDSQQLSGACKLRSHLDARFGPQAPSVEAAWTLSHGIAQRAIRRSAVWPTAGQCQAALDPSTHRTASAAE